jgi:[acyl-carrier-protein] S-malonyltransferase
MVTAFATGLRVVAERGRLMQQACEQSVGGMAAVIGEERAKVAELCAEFGIEAANFNAPGQIIISGEKPRVEAAVAAAKDRGIKKVIPLNVAGAYHSRLMEPARVEFARFLEGVTFAAPQFTVFTNTTGTGRVSDPAAIREALIKQVVSSVLLGGLHALRRRGRCDRILGTRPPQFLHHRARRPRQDDALRPPAAGDRTPSATAS